MPYNASQTSIIVPLVLSHTTLLQSPSAALPVAAAARFPRPAHLAAATRACCSLPFAPDGLRLFHKRVGVLSPVLGGPVVRETPVVTIIHYCTSGHCSSNDKSCENPSQIRDLNLNASPTPRPGRE